MEKDDHSPDWEMAKRFGLVYASLFSCFEEQLLPQPTHYPVVVSLMAANTIIVLLIRYSQVYKKRLSVSTVVSFWKLLGPQWSFILIFALFVWPNELWLNRVFPVKGSIDTILAALIPTCCSMLIIFTAQTWYRQKYPEKEKEKQQ